MRCKLTFALSMLPESKSTSWRLALALALLCGGVSHADDAPTRPVIARLALWVAPERMAETGSAFDEHVLPLLQARGFVPTDQQSRATPDSVFTRLFAFESR